MEDNQNMNFECEPVQEPVQRTEPYTVPEQPTYRPYYQDDNRKNKKKKDRTTGKLVALIAAVAVIGSIGGSLLTSAIANLSAPKAEEPAEVTQQTVEEKPAFERVERTLPAQLKTNDTGKSLTTVQVYELTVNSVVGINTEITTNVFGQEAVSASSGSGFILSEDGYIITNCHVVEGASVIRVALFNGDEFEAELVGSDNRFDIAVLKIEAKGLPAVSVADSDTLKVGEEVVAIGNPLGELTFTMTNGILSALDREINTDGNPQNMLQTNAAINSGNSGGPLFDMDGNVIGVTTAKYSGSSSSGTSIEGLGFAIPINDALKVAYDLVEYGYVKGQAYLGVTVETLDSQTASYYSLPVGPRVAAVNPGSCAEKAGITVGDIILRFNGIDVENNTALLSALKKVQAGDTVNVTLFRAGADLEVSVTLDERPEESVLEQQVQEYENQKKPETYQGESGDYYYQFPDGFDFNFGG